MRERHGCGWQAQQPRPLGARAKHTEAHVDHHVVRAGWRLILVDDVSRKLFDRLPDETWFYPGHGNDSTLGAERPHVAGWRSRGW